MAFTFAGQWGPEPVLDLRGNAQPNAVCRLLLSDGATLATRYADRSKATTATNPFNADSLGNVVLFADPGFYVLRVTVHDHNTDLHIEVPLDPLETLSAGSLADEAAARTAADLAEQTARINADAAEATARANADADEVVARAAGDAASAAALVVESDARQSAVTAEAAARGAADTAEANTRAQADSDEAAARLAADTAEAGTRASADSSHAAATTGIHGVGGSTVESTSGAQTKADAAGAAAVVTAEAYTDAAIALQVPRLGLTADLPANSHKITGLAAPTNAGDAVTKSYADSLAGGFKQLAAAVAVAASNIALTGLQTVDGIVLTDAQRVLLVGQTTASERGLWLAHAGGWTRPTDFASGSSQTQGTSVFVPGDPAVSTYANTGWVLLGTVTVDTDAQSWTQTSGGSVGAGAGLTKVGNIVSVATGGVTSGMIADGAIVDADVAAANKDGAAGTPSLRTLGIGSAQAAAGNDSRVVGAQQTSAKDVANGYAGLDSGAKLKVAEMVRLDQIPAPTTDVALATHKLTGVGDPTAAQDASTKHYVDTSTDPAGTAAGAVAAHAALIATHGADPATESLLIVHAKYGLTRRIYIIEDGDATPNSTDGDMRFVLPVGFFPAP